MDNDTKGIILTADDDSQTLGMINTVLIKAGYSSLLAMDGEQVLSICSRIVPDLILMDAFMPQLDGFETCRRLRKDPLFAHIPVIFMTGLDHDDSLQLSFEAGAIDYLKKPINLNELLIRIKSHLQKSKSYFAAFESLDNNNLTGFGFKDDLSFSYITPNALKLFEKYGYNRIDLVELFSSKLKTWIQVAKPGDVFLLDNAVSLIISYSGRNSANEYVVRVYEKEEIKEDQKYLMLQQAFGLTLREAQVLYYISLGKSNKEIGIILGISSRTVDKHTEMIFQKLMVDNRTSAAFIANQHLNA
ncbi:DNA-binding response regulator [Succinatimonas hippei]|uniref:response regulator transcription factor n=1 Tax=Succinatimonas hippei TaxID=626938 RepID=UPI0020118EC4|nr:DNA-binding response regulator [Succinatimonas hippei]MCL1602945.1 DNA-binding response regulator [Succinatimonas hippei]